MSSSTSSARSSIRALRSASIVVSMPSSRRTALFERPLTSASRREIGAAPRGRPVTEALCAEDLVAQRGDLERTLAVRHVGWIARELDYDLPQELIAQHPGRSGATSRGCSSTRARPGQSRTTSSASCRRAAADALAVVNDTRVVPARIPIESPRGEVLLARAARRRRVGGARAPDAPAARRPPLRRGRAARASRRGPLAACGSTASRRARRRCRRTSPSRSPIPSATRRSTRASRARPRRRPPGCTSRRRCSRSSTSSA